MWLFLTQMETMQRSPKSIQVILRSTLTPVGSKFQHISQENMFMYFPPGKKLLQIAKELQLSYFPLRKPPLHSSRYAGGRLGGTQLHPR